MAYKKVDNRTSAQKSIDERKRVFQDLLVNSILVHEDLVPYQLPFRLPDADKRPKARAAMEKWVSMFDDEDKKLILAPKYKKLKGTENFLYVKKLEDVPRAVNMQLKRYATHKNFAAWRKEVGGEPTVDDAMALFDQTGANGKIDFLNRQGIDTNIKLKEIY